MDPFTIALIIGIGSMIMGGAGLAISVSESSKNDDRYEEQQRQYAEQVRRAEEQYAEQMRMAQDQNDRYEAELLKQTVEADVDTSHLESTPYGQAQQAATNATNALRLNFIHSFGKTNRSGFKHGTARTTVSKSETQSTVSGVAELAINKVKNTASKLFKTVGNYKGGK